MGRRSRKHSPREQACDNQKPLCNHAKTDSRIDQLRPLRIATEHLSFVSMHILQTSDMYTGRLGNRDAIHVNASAKVVLLVRILDLESEEAGLS